MDRDAVDALRGADDGSRPPGTDASGRVAHGGTEDPWLVDFSANVNPHIPDGTARVYEAALSAARSHPSDDYCEFRAAAAESLDCEAPQIIPTAGALAAIRLVVGTAVGAGDAVLVPFPSFGEYAREVRLQGGEPTFVRDADLLAADPAEHALAIVCNPSNPTGLAYDPSELRAFADRCRAAGTLLLVDEAFLGFTEHPSLAGREGVVAVRSLANLYGLPGLRAGFAVAAGECRERLETARLPRAIGAPAAAVGAHCLAADEFVADTRERVRTERARMRDQLSTRFEVRPSAAPFLLLDAGTPDAVDDLLEEAREAGLSLRDARTFRGLDSHVRVAVRLPDENDRLLDALAV
ncbi:MAG: aminotransferase class I/II-fold pyridoxal phosphate-dependent enzyme [Haloarculaceae archaeon]